MKKISLFLLGVSSLFFIACGDGSSGGSGGSSDALAALNSAQLIFIYNNVSSKGVDNFAKNGVGEGAFSQYDKEENIHCSDFGFSDIWTQGDHNGYYTIIYKMGDKLCNQTDGSASGYSGDKNVAFYK